MMSLLPEEVLLLIFQSYIHDQRILTRHDIYQCQLVCKGWKIAAQRTNYTSLKLYQQHNIPKLISSLSPFNTPGKFLKRLEMTIPTHQQFLLQLVDIFPFVDTIIVSEPNIEFYSNLITIHHHKKWKYLKNISLPKTFDLDLLKVYTECISLYQSTLQHVLMYKNKLELCQFPKLQQLTMKQDISCDFKYLDRMIDSCKELNKLDVGLYQPLYEFSIIDIIPNSKLKLLDCLFVVQDEILIYIMHKFPQLQELYINHVWREDSIKVTNNSSLNLSTLSQFMEYIVLIPSCAISIYLDNTLITYGLNVYTQSIKTLGPLSITYTRDEHSLTQWTMHRTNNSSHEFYIDYHCSNNTLLHLTLIETIGKYLKELTYRSGIDSIGHVHGYFLNHLLQHCSNLTKLRISSTKLIKCLYPPFHHPTLTHLVLLNCYLGKNILSQLSCWFKQLKKLIIVRCMFGNSGLDKRFFHIDMKHTEIDTIRLKTEDASIHHIFVQLNQRFFLLEWDGNGYNTKESHEQEYEYDMKVWVQCKKIRCLQLFTNSKSMVRFGQIVW